MADFPLRTRLLLLLRSSLWRSERQLCRAICRRNVNVEVTHELDVMHGEGLVQRWDSSDRRWEITTKGRNEAARLGARRRKAA